LPFSPQSPTRLSTINVDIKNASLWDVLEFFSVRGVGTIEGEVFSKLQAVRKALAGGGKILGLH
jgi:hypothetical protein